MRKSETITLDWHSFMRGKIVAREPVSLNHAILQGLEMIAAAGVVVTSLDITEAYAEAQEPQAVEVTTDNSLDGMHFKDDASWADYIVPLIRHQALPLTITMVCWAGLEMILRHPQSAMDRAKWAVLGYIGLNFAIPFVKGLGHRFGD